MAGSAQNPLTLNRYLYANANPATLVDPDGHISVMHDGGRDVATQDPGLCAASRGQYGCPTTTTPTTTSIPNEPTDSDTIVVAGPISPEATSFSLDDELPTITKNSRQGKQFEAEFRAALKEYLEKRYGDRYEIVEQKALRNDQGGAIRVGDNKGPKVYDFIIRNKETGRIVATIECKSGHAIEYKFDIRTSQQLTDQLKTANVSTGRPSTNLAYKNVETDAVSLYGEDWVASKIGVKTNKGAGDPVLDAGLKDLTKGGVNRTGFDGGSISWRMMEQCQRTKAVMTTVTVTHPSFESGLSGWSSRRSSNPVSATEPSPA